MSWMESFGVEHPTQRIKRSALFTIVALALAIRDLWKIRGLADQARDVERDVRARLGSELDQVEELHRERISDLHRQIADMRARGFQPPAPAPPAPAVDPEPDVEVAE